MMAWRPHRAEFTVPSRYEACTASSRTVFPRLHAERTFQSEQLLKQDIRAEGRTKTLRSAWTDFVNEAQCSSSSAAPCGDDATQLLTAARLRSALGNRTLLLLGDSVMGQLMGFLSCWLLSNATAPAAAAAASGGSTSSSGPSEAEVAAESAAWLQHWDEALLERAKALGFSKSHPLVQRAARRPQAWPLHTRGTAVVTDFARPLREKELRARTLSAHARSLARSLAHTHARTHARTRCATTTALLRRRAFALQAIPGGAQRGAQGGAGPTLAMLSVSLFLPPSVRWHELVGDWFLPMLSADAEKAVPR